MIDARHWRRLALAALVSGVAHAAIVAFGHIDLPAPAEARLPLAARLVSAPPAEPVAAPVPSVARASPPTPLPRPAVVARTKSPSSWAVLDDRPERGARGVEPITQESVAEAPADVSPTAAEPVVIATAPPSTYVPEAPPLRGLPKKGRITYNLVYGRDGFPVGRTIQTWEMDGGSYKLASRSETTGIVDLFRSQHRTYFSRGSVTREGLRPATFLSSRNRGRGIEEARAQFDWDDATVRLQSGSGQKNEALPPRSQDLLSFVYQLSLDPPPQGRLRQVVTNGTRIEIYELDVMPEETIETPLGALRTLRLKQRPKAGQEGIELWLATEYRYLPVRLRFFNREGEPQGEQIVTEIRLSDD